MSPRAGSPGASVRRACAVIVASLLLAGMPGPLPAVGLPSPISTKSADTIEIESSPLFDQSLQHTIAVLDSEARSEKLKVAREDADEPRVKITPSLVTMDFTCAGSSTCGTTCVGTYTCNYTCAITCFTTCDDYTCIGTATCSNTCVGSYTCGYTCDVTCASTCTGTTTCSSTCGTTCTGTTCTTTCGTTCTGTTCTTTCGTTCTGTTCDGTTCDGATCDVTCEGVTCGATCGTDCDPAAVELFDDGFESWPGPWSASSEADPTWGLTDHRQSEGSSSAYCAGSTIAAPGPYANGMLAWLTAGPFDLSGDSAPTLVFDLWLDSEQDYDTLWAGASIDDVHYEMVGWSGDTEGWVTMEVDLGDVFGDGTVSFDGEPAVWISFLFESDDSVTDEGAYVDNVRVLTVPDATIDDGCVRLAGSSRYETSILASKEGFPAGASTVVIATGANWPDALGGSALAGAVSGPLLLTDPNVLRSDVSAEITRLGATGAYILGGTGAVSGVVENALRTLLDGNVKRLQGASRYETAARVAEETIAQLGNGYSGEIFVATGANFPDATAAAPLAAALHRPILLANPYATFDQAVMLPPEASSAFILGGTAAVSAGVETALNDDLDSVTRLAGSTRYQTAVKVAEHGVDEGMQWNGVGIATGDNFPDALSGGAMLGRLGSVMLLTLPTALPWDTQAALQDNASAIDAMFIFGGTGAVSTSVEQAAKAAAGVP